jgi:hypothetical protein
MTVRVVCKDVAQWKYRLGSQVACDDRSSRDLEGLG